MPKTTVTLGSTQERTPERALDKLGIGQNIEFTFCYLNTKKNVIKYIEMFFVVTNNVEDVLSRSFKETESLEEWVSQARTRITTCTKC